MLLQEHCHEFKEYRRDAEHTQEGREGESERGRERERLERGRKKRRRHSRREEVVVLSTVL